MSRSSSRTGRGSNVEQERAEGRTGVGAAGGVRDLLHLTDVDFAPASASDTASGLLGWVGFSVGALRLDSVQIRRTRDGHLELSFPGRRSRSGRMRRYVVPLNPEARGEIERQVLAELRRRGVAL